VGAESANGRISESQNLEYAALSHSVILSFADSAYRFLAHSDRAGVSPCPSLCRTFSRGAFADSRLFAFSLYRFLAPFNKLYEHVVEKGLIDCVCKACAIKTEALAGIEAQGLPFCGEMKGHPSIARYMDAGYEVITF